MIEHNYKSIHGWFDMEEEYLYLLNKVPDNGYFVELGAWLGKSTSFIVTEFLNRNRKINFFSIDNFEGITNYSLELEKKIYYDFEENFFDLKNIYDLYLRNTNHLRNYYTTLKSDSSLASLKFKDNSIDAIFIDAGHSYESVKKDIDYWLPKMKNGSVIAGHDYHWDSVKKAVNESFSIIRSQNACWFVDIVK